VNYLAAPGDLSFAAYCDDPLELVYDKEVRIYRNKSYYPRAFAVYRADIILDDQTALSELQSMSCYLRQCVILAEPLGKNETLEQVPALASGMEVRRLSYGPNTVYLDVSMAHNGFIVLGDVYYPGWKAFVDGREMMVHRADYALRAVFVEEGDHRVQLVFRPMSFQFGACLSLFGLVLSLGLGTNAVFHMHVRRGCRLEWTGIKKDR
jgi:hypothetical protein